MKSYFETKVKYDKTGEDGTIKSFTEVNIVDALSFTECEARIIKETKPFVSGEMLVSGIKREKIAEVFFNSDTNADKWFKCKVEFISLDEEKGVERRIPSYMLVQAETVKTAEAYLTVKMKNTLADWSLCSVSETKILNVYEYEPQK